MKYPNGAIHYRGEYKNDQMVRLWTTFNEKGEVETEMENETGLFVEAINFEKSINVAIMIPYELNKYSYSIK